MRPAGRFVADVLTELASETGARAVYCSRAYEPWARRVEEEAKAAVAKLEGRARPPRDPRRLAALAARVALAGDATTDLATLARAAAADPVDCAAKLAYARALAAAGDYERALQELLAIVRADRRFDDDVGRRTMLTVFEALPAESDLVRRYRRELASALN